MEKFIWMLSATLLIPGLVYAQTRQAGATAAATSLSEPASQSNSKIVIKTQPLRNNTIDVKLNGRVIATMEGDQTHTGVFAPGKMRITVPGEKPESSVEFEAEANKEYLFEVALVPSTSGFLLFGIVGSSAMATYAIALKETKLIAASSAPPVGAADQAARQAREDEQQRARQQQDRRQAEEAQRRARAGEEAKRAEPVKAVAKAEVSAAPVASIDFTAEAKKSSKILGCNSEDVRVVGVDGQNILFSTSCQNGPNLVLSCDPTGLCLRK